MAGTVAKRTELAFGRRHNAANFGESVTLLFSNSCNLCLPEQISLHRMREPPSVTAIKTNLLSEPTWIHTEILYL